MQFFENTKDHFSVTKACHDRHNSNCFVQFSRDFRQTEKLADETKTLFSKVVACFILVCINDVGVNFFSIVYLGKCGFPVQAIKYAMSFSIVNFFAFATPCCYLYSKVRKEENMNVLCNNKEENTKRYKTTL